jgi:hypothetical protein
MPNLRLTSLLIGVAALAACPSSDDPILPDDGPPIDRAIACDGSGCPIPECDGGFGASCDGDCNPLGAPGQQGCAVGRRCVWEIVAEDPEPIGRIACVPDGTVALGGACTAATAGAPDDCQSGLVCVGGACADICGFDGSAAAACAAGDFCARYNGLYANGDDDPVAGACNPGCDPLTQLRSDGTSCGAGKGCYLLTSQVDTIAVCASAGDVPVGGSIDGPGSANACVPGAAIRRRDQTSNVVECGGLCEPAEVTSTTNMTAEAGVAPDDCVGRWGAAPPGDGIAGESCRYWWARESFDGLSTFSNTVGWCFKHAVFRYDADGDQTLDTAFPRCTTLTTGDVVPPIGNPPHNDAQYFWCTELPATFQLFGRPISRAPRAPMPQLHADRLSWRRER